MPPQTDLLFVYGTLMSAVTGGMGARERLRLGREASSLGAAMVVGRLIDCGRYPGLLAPCSWSVEAADRAGVVHGELLRLADPDTTFAWLDRYEGILPACGGSCEYRREVVDAVRAAHPHLVQSAHVYVFQGRADGARTVADGRWQPFAGG